MRKKQKNTIITIAFIVGLLILVGALQGGLPFAVSGGEDIKFAIPHMASFKCEPVQDKFGISISIPDGGALISKETIGFNTNGISNIQIVSGGRWKNARLRYFICDANGLNCGSEKEFSIQTKGTYTLSVSSLDFESQSLKLYSEEIGTVQIWKWFYFGGTKITFDGKVFGLRLYSTTRDPAGAKICTTSCNLDCPDIGHREKLIFTDKTQLGFYETTPYLEYWETIDYDLNQQGGATIYNSATKKFCFAGAVYSAGTLKMENGDKYIYPNINTRQDKACCPGATISSTYSDLVCQSNYNWKVIADTDKLTCISDFNCPAQGGATCQNKLLSGYHCKNKDSNNVGICIKALGTPVSCCVNGDCVRDQVCDTSSHTCKGGTILPVCGDGKVDAGEQCDDGNLISGDGCTTTCEQEVEYCVSHPEDKVCQKPCAWYDLPCHIERIFGFLGNIIKAVRYIVLAIATIFSLFLSKEFISGFFKKKTKEDKIVIWILSILIAMGVGLILYSVLITYFWWVVFGLIIFALIYKFILKKPLRALFKK